MERPDFFELKNGEKVKLPFSDKEYKNRVNKLRSIMDKNNLDMIILTSMHNIAYYTGFIYCSFGRPYGCIITKKKISTISANIDASQPWRRSHCNNVNSAAAIAFDPIEYKIKPKQTRVPCKENKLLL